MGTATCRFGAPDGFTAGDCLTCEILGEMAVDGRLALYALRVVESDTERGEAVGWCSVLDSDGPALPYVELTGVRRAPAVEE